PRLPRRRRDARDACPRPAEQPVDQARLPDVRPPRERDLLQPVRRFGARARHRTRKLHRLDLQRVPAPHSDPQTPARRAAQRLSPLRRPAALVPPLAAASRTLTLPSSAPRDAAPATAECPP